MKKGIELVNIPKHQYSQYRYEVIFHAYKWDPQVEDANTVSEYVALLSEDTVRELAVMAEQLAQETVAMETELLRNLFEARELGLPQVMIRTMRRAANYQSEEHVRLMRFDFHPTDQGWMISEVNSDVPGGFAESSALPQIARRFMGQGRPAEDLSSHLYRAFEKRIKPGGTMAFVHATAYADDRQVMQFMGDYFEQRGYQALYLAPDHIRFKQRQAFSILERYQQNVDGIFRFFPLEWLPELPFSSRWQGYYDTLTPSCNHPVAMLTQSKRLPLLWDRLQAPHTVWKQLLPETEPVRKLDYGDPDYIYKPAFGRVGGGITITEAMPEGEFKKIKKETQRRKKEWLVQKRFRSIPVTAEDGKSFHLCIGVFVVDGKYAGFYGRISPYARIDEKAKDIPILIKQGGA